MTIIESDTKYSMPARSTARYSRRTFLNVLIGTGMSLMNIPLLSSRASAAPVPERVVGWRRSPVNELERLIVSNFEDYSSQAYRETGDIMLATYDTRFHGYLQENLTSASI